MKLTLYLKVLLTLKFKSNRILSFSCLLIIISCSSSGNSGNKSTSFYYFDDIPRLSHPNQLIAPDNIRSISLSNNNRKNTPIPVISLGSNQQLTLSFDELDDISTSFGIRFKRFDRNWNETNLVPTQISTGILDDLIKNVARSEDEFPIYYHYSYTFPNQLIEFTLSGNWMLEVYDFQTNEPFFSLPFFISDDSGNLGIDLEVLNFDSRNSRYQHQFFIDYSFPENLRLPEFNIEARVLQDGHFALEKDMTTKDLSRRSDGIIRFQLNREEALPAQFDHQSLGISILREGGMIRYVDERANEPVEIQLLDDVQAFEQSRGSSALNDPNSTVKARYANVVFSFIPSFTLDYDQQIFVTGKFNQWSLQPEFELSWNEAQQRYMTTALLKQGSYSYSYIVLDGDEILAQLSQNRFGSTKRNYQFLIYYQDPNLFLDRLLLVESIETD